MPSMATESAGDDVVASVKKKRTTFLDLPAETQQEIISHCSQTDLICVALVSKHFHELASAQLYRNFHIIFPDDDDMNFDSPIDGLAGGLDTFTTSEYNIAKHLKDLSMDTLSAGIKGEMSYQSYLYSASCGKFLNTLLCLTLKKAKSLEAFRWNIRVELSRPVYQELHRITSLKKLHIRMQAGESYYIPPPPLPVSADALAGGPPTHWTEHSPTSPTPLPDIVPLSLFGNSSFVPTTPPALVPPSKSLPKSKASRRSYPSRDPSTFSGFKGLKSLCVLDIDDLDIMTELKACIKNSSSTLNELQLSLSDSLASQARRPPPDSDPEDSDVDDEFQVIPTSQSPGHDGSGPARVFRAQEERKVQEAVLGRIFDVEHMATKNPRDQRVANDREPLCTRDEGDEPSDKDPREEFISSIRAVSSQLLRLLNGPGDLSTAQQDILNTIEKAARKYVLSGDALDQPTGTAESQGASQATDIDGAGPSSLSAPTIVDAGAAGQGAASPSSAETNENNDAEPKPATIDAAEDSSVSNQSNGKYIAGNTLSPEDIDMEHIETMDDVFEDSVEQTGKLMNQMGEPSESTISAPSDSFFMTTPASSTSNTSSNDKVVSNLANRKMRYQGLLADHSHLQKRTAVLRTKVRELQQGGTTMGSSRIEQVQHELHKVITIVSDVENQLKAMKVEIEHMEKQITPKPPAASAEMVKRCMNDYVRDTRGFSLETLSVYLMPVKASVISGAINLRSLRQLTLLNVGNQTPIWTLISKENRTYPLPLRSVFTDNVSNAFLTCVSQLDELHELFLLERSMKYKPESFAPRSTTTIDQIRRMVLSKHLPTLKRLMIKDDSSSSNWDANVKTITQICNRGTQLEELAVSMNIQAVHAFMQYMSGLVNLRAIHILHFKNNDTCIWVMRELLRFIVDNLSHRPELKIEWIAMADERVDRVVRPSEDGQQKPGDSNKKTKGKSKVVGPPPSTSAYPLLPSIETESDTESDEDGFDSGSRLRYKTVGPMQFYDVWGVKIFEKEIRTGRL